MTTTTTTYSRRTASMLIDFVPDYAEVTRTEDHDDGFHSIALVAGSKQAARDALVTACEHMAPRCSRLYVAEMLYGAQSDRFYGIFRIVDTRPLPTCYGAEDEHGHAACEGQDTQPVVVRTPDGIEFTTLWCLDCRDAGRTLDYLVTINQQRA